MNGKQGLCLMVAVALLCAASAARAEWKPNGNVICYMDHNQGQAQVANTGDGGAVIAWNDNRSGWIAHIFAQKVSGDGSILWQNQGVFICSLTGSLRGGCRVIADGSGGAVVAWWDRRGGNLDIYAQRIDANGVVQWTANGVPLCTAAGDQERPEIVADGAGGAIAVWQDHRSGSEFDVYAQRIDGAGAVRWQLDGLPVCTAGGNQLTPSIASDGAGGCILTWFDYRSGAADIYAQRIDASGTTRWGADGIAVCVADGMQYEPRIMPDDAGGAVIVWTDSRSGSYGIYAQRVDANGSRLWTADGIPVGMGTWPALLSDGAGGAIITWMASVVFAQRVDATGEIRWKVNGVRLCTSFGSQLFPKIASNGKGGAIVVWRDERGGAVDLYAGGVDADGSLLLNPAGVPICTAPEEQGPCEIASDGSGGGYIVWDDERNGGINNHDIYATRIYNVVPPRPVCLDIRPGSCPNPFNPKANGVLPVAVLGTSDLDVNEIDPATIEFEGVPPLRWSLEDVAGCAAGEDSCACSDAGPDGMVDLALKFDIPALVEQIGPRAPGDVVRLTMTGALRGGTEIEGSDCVVVVGGGPKKESRERGRLNIAIGSGATETVQRIRYTLPARSTVGIEIYDVSGRLVQRFEGLEQPAGEHVREWNTAGLASGVYFCKVAAPPDVAVTKIVILK